MRLFFFAPFLLGLAACAAKTPHFIEPAAVLPVAEPTVTAVVAAPALTLPAPTPLPSPSAQPPPPQADEPPRATVVLRGTTATSNLAPAYAPLDPALPPPPTAVPAPVPLFKHDGDITLFAVLGNDVQSRQGGRTDSIILAAVNTRAQTVSLLSIPRDLYVVMPGWTMGRLNTAYAHGGAELFKETVAYNLGLPVDHTIRVGFDGFKRIVDMLGGIELVVNCPVDDWRLKSPELDPELESSWQPFELGYGIQEMDGELALWYARSRRSTNDFDRSRRQQKILRALWHSSASPATLAQLPALVRALWPAVQTNLAIGETLQLAARVPGMEAYTVRSILLPRQALRPWKVPGSGAAVQLLDWQKVQPTLQAFLAEPALHAAGSASIRVAIQSSDYVLYQQAAENLSWYGFEPVYEPPTDQPLPQTTIIHNGPTLKGAYPARLAWIFRQDLHSIQLQPYNPTESIDYRVNLAPTYNPCLDYLTGPPVSSSQ